jgi:hypothetical protein
VRLSGFRNFTYRSEGDFDARYEQRQVSLAHLVGVDLFVSYWKVGPVAHTFVSFTFDDGTPPVCVSIEARPEVGERFDVLATLFKQYALIYVVGDERGLVRVRTEHRGEVASARRTDTPLLFAQVGVIDTCAQAEVRCALRADTPLQLTPGDVASAPNATTRTYFGVSDRKRASRTGASRSQRPACQGQWWPAVADTRRLPSGWGPLGPCDGRRLSSELEIGQERLFPLLPTPRTSRRGGASRCNIGRGRPWSKWRGRSRGRR